MNLSKQFGLLLVSLLIAIVTVIGSGLLGLRRMNGAVTTLVQHDLQQVLRLTHARRLFRSFALAEEEALAAPAPEALAGRVAHMRDMQVQLVGKLDELARDMSEDDRADMEALREVDARWIAVDREVMARLEAGAPTEARVRAMLHEPSGSWEVLIARVLARSELRMEHRLRDAHSLYHRAAAALGLIAILVALAVAIVGSRVFRGIRRAMDHVVELNAVLERRVDERTRALSDANRNLQDKIDELQDTRRALSDASRRAGMAEVASNVLHNVGNILNSVNVATQLLGDTLRSSKGKGLTKLAHLLEEHAGNLAPFFAEQRGQQLPRYLGALAEALEQERQIMIEEADAVSSNLDQIRMVIAAQQSTAQAVPVQEKVNLGQLIDEALSSASAGAEGSVEVLRQFELREPIQVDRFRLLRMLESLLSNAYHAVSRQPAKRIEIRTRAASDGRFIVEVADSGYGLSSEKLTRIFSHGYSTKLGGQGFGLHVSACTALEMGGRLTAHSDGTGRGACFRIELPMKAA